MPPKVRPSSIEGIKRLAKRIASEKTVKHTAALDEAARVAGYQTFLHAKRGLSDAKAPAPIPNARKDKPMSSHDFKTFARARWVETINQFAPDGDMTIEWTKIDEIIAVLAPFMGSGKNHTHLPRGGGFDFLSVSRSPEKGCVEFGISGETAVVARPRRLVLERLASDPVQSFLMLELDELKPSAVNEEDAQAAQEHRQEEVIDIGRGRYVGLDADDDALPDGARTVLRLFNGQLMFVTKGSLWNGSSQTYRGTHDTGTHSEIRSLVQRWSDHAAEARSEAAR